jgi:hypothetical protein
MVRHRGRQRLKLGATDPARPRAGQPQIILDDSARSQEGLEGGATLVMVQDSFEELRSKVRAR